ncbi:MAG: hypothetical protein AAB467_04000 [Patescibacteria group bacterium]
MKNFTYLTALLYLAVFPVVASAEEKAGSQAADAGTPNVEKQNLDIANVDTFGVTVSLTRAHDDGIFPTHVNVEVAFDQDGKEATVKLFCHPCRGNPNECAKGETADFFCTVIGGTQVFGVTLNPCKAHNDTFVKTHQCPLITTLQGQAETQTTPVCHQCTGIFAELCARHKTRDFLCQRKAPKK